MALGEHAVALCQVRSAKDLSRGTSGEDLQQLGRSTRVLAAQVHRELTDC